MPNKQDSWSREELMVKCKVQTGMLEERSAVVETISEQLVIAV